MNPTDAHSRLIVALDVPDWSRAEPLVRALAPEVGLFKVGLELFVAEGPAVVSRVREMGGRVFLDLKLHDIPNTVASAVRNAVKLGADMLTLHATGGAAMMKAASQAVLDGAAVVGSPPPLLLGVTVLTSHDEASWAESAHAYAPADAVERLARLAFASGVGGAVCSPLEVSRLRAAGYAGRLVVPGVRPAGADKGDQARVATPADTLAAGADWLVVGRPIVQAADPVAAARAIVAEMASGLAQRG